MKAVIQQLIQRRYRRSNNNKFLTYARIVADETCNYKKKPINATQSYW